MPRPGRSRWRSETKALKAVFFVKDFIGKPEYQARQVFDQGRPPNGRKVKVVFTDGEVLVGTTQAVPAQPARALHATGRSGFQHRAVLRARRGHA